MEQQESQITPIVKRPINTFLLMSIVIVLILVSGIIGYNIGLKKSTLPVPTNILPTPSSAISPSIIPKTIISKVKSLDLATYINTSYGYSLKYPQEFVVEENEIAICPTLDPLIPPVVPGCTAIEKKGERATIYSKNRGSRSDSGAYSEVLLRVSNEPQVQDEVCSSLKTEPVYKEITLNGMRVFEVMDNNDNFAYIVSKHTTKKDPNREGFNLYCEAVGLPVKNYTLLINAGIGGVAKEDIEIVMAIIKSISF